MRGSKTRWMLAVAAAFIAFAVPASQAQAAGGTFCSGVVLKPGQTCSSPQAVMGTASARFVTGWGSISVGGRGSTCFSAGCTATVKLTILADTKATIINRSLSTTTVYGSYSAVTASSARATELRHLMKAMMATSLCRHTNLCAGAYPRVINGHVSLYLRHKLVARAASVKTPAFVLDGCLSSWGATYGGALVRYALPCSYWTTGNRNQTWYVGYSGSGVGWQIANGGSMAGSCLNDRQGSYAPGNVINMWACDGSTWQTWVIQNLRSFNGGYWVFITPYSNRYASCITIAPGGSGIGYNGEYPTIQYCSSDSASQLYRDQEFWIQ